MDPVTRWLPNYIIGMFMAINYMFYKLTIRDQFIGRISVNTSVFFMGRGASFPLMVEARFLDGVHTGIGWVLTGLCD